MLALEEETLADAQDTIAEATVQTIELESDESAFRPLPLVRRTEASALLSPPTTSRIDFQPA